MKRIIVAAIVCLFVFALGVVMGVVTGCGQPEAPPAPAPVVEPPKTEPAPTADKTPQGEMKTVEPAATNPAAPAPAAKQMFALSPETAIIWAASVPIGTRTGGWTDFTGTIEIDGGNFETAKISAEVKMSSAFSDAAEITTKMKGDEHFFAPGKFPTSKFTSTAVKKTATGYDVAGDLTIRDKTKSVVFPVTDVKIDGKTLTCKSKLTLNRHDFGIEYNSTIGDYAINDKCDLNLEVIAEGK